MRKLEPRKFKQMAWYPLRRAATLRVEIWFKEQENLIWRLAKTTFTGEVVWLQTGENSNWAKFTRIWTSATQQRRQSEPQSWGLLWTEEVTDRGCFTESVTTLSGSYWHTCTHILQPHAHAWTDTNQSCQWTPAKSHLPGPGSLGLVNPHISLGSLWSGKTQQACGWKRRHFTEVVQRMTDRSRFYKDFNINWLSL